MMSGWITDISASAFGSALTSSSATPQPRVRRSVSARRSRSGRATSARSSTSRTNVGPPAGASSPWTSEAGPTAASPSALTLRNSANGAPRPACIGALERQRAAGGVQLGGERARARRGEELGRGLQPGGVATRQRLVADDAAVPEIDDGLVVRAEAGEAG